MYPAFIHWWKSRHTACGEAPAYAGCGPSACHWPRGADDEPRREAARFDCGDEGSVFGVKRPLRFLAYKLGLDEAKVAELARIISELKTERAQAEVDQRRTLTAFADAVAGTAFDGAKAREGAQLRVASAERLRDAVLKALEQIHGLLDAEQRAKLAYLIRTGALLM